MRPLLKKALAGTALLALLATAGPFIGGAPSAIAATDNGTATISPTSGTSATNFTLGLGSNPSCPGDSSSGNYRVQSFMIPAAADVDATLRFNANGPTTVGSEFRQPLFDATSNPYVNELTDQAVAPAVTGGISGLPQFNWGATFGPGDVPAGQYRIGIACTLGPASSADQLVSYWSKLITVTATGVGNGGPAQFDWAQGATPLAPVLASPLGAADGSLTATFTQPGPPDPAVTGYTVTATPTPSGSPVTATGTTSPITLTGLTNGTAYDVTVRATNGQGDSPESNVVSGTPNPPAVYDVDGEIRRSSQTAFVGDGVYNLTGAGQTRSTNVRRSKSTEFVVRVRNESNTTDSIRVKGQAGNSRFTVRYFNGSTNVTSQVVAGTFTFNGMAPDSTRTLRVKFTVARNATVNSSRSVTVTATSVGDTAQKDTVKATVKAVR